MVFLLTGVLIPLLIGLVIVITAVITICRLFFQDVARDRRRRRRANGGPMAVPGAYLPRWRAYTRRTAQQELDEWERRFRSALPR